MRVSSNRVALLVLVFALVACVVSNVSAQDDVSAQVLKRINRARADANLPALERNAQLDAAAQGHANDLLQNGAQLGHRGSDGSNIKQRIARAGYNGAFVGENWAGYRTLDKIFEFWLNDPPHYKNIVNAKYREVGIGVGARANGGYIIVTDFGAQANGAESSAAQPTNVPPKSKPTQVPTKPKPQPTRKPTRQPTAVPTQIPTQVPTVVQVAIAEPSVKKSLVPLRVRGKIARVGLNGRAEVSIASTRVQADAMRLWFGGALFVAGALLLCVSIVGHRRRRWYR